MAMKKIIPILLALLLLAGCKIDAEIWPDTIVDIPVDPTEAVTEEISEATEPTTEPPTEEPTESPTAPPTEKPTEKPKNNSSNSSSKKPSSKKKDQSTKSTDPMKATEATKATEPPTVAPTEKPTVPPTEAPTEAPTDPPTEAPTEPPTEAPTVVPTETPTQPSISSYSPTKLDKSVVAAINAQRADAGLPELGTSKKLNNAAGQRAYEISENWSHSRPDGSDFSTVLAEYGIKSTNCAETLHYTVAAPSADEPVDRWMGSNQHREIILSENFRTIAVANYSIDGITYIAALFIR